MTGEPSTAPARGYSWPPFEPGHELSTKHGAYSPRRVDPLAEEQVAGLLALAEAIPELAYLDRPEFRPAVWAWARSEARVQLLTEYLIDHGLLTAKGKPMAAFKLLQREEAAAATRRQALGLDPLSRARLGRDTAAGSMDAARLMAMMADADPPEPDAGAEAAPEEPLRNVDGSDG